MEDINKFILGIVVVGLTLVISIFIASTIQSATDETASIGIVNETGAWLNSTTYRVDNYKDAMIIKSMIEKAHGKEMAVMSYQKGMDPDEIYWTSDHCYLHHQ